MPNTHASPPRLLVVEGNTAAARARHTHFGGEPPSEGYSRLLRELLPGATVDICYPADAGANVPDGGGLESYDGIAITGSSLNIYNGGPEIGRQIELIRTGFASGTPLFGSCWGLQVLTVAAGGTVRRNPRGRELGFGRRIRLTPAGNTHPLYAGKPTVFEAMTVHLDEVETLPGGAELLATNGHSGVQAAEIRVNGTVAWGVQYHPEYPFREMAAIVRRIGDAVFDEGFFANVTERDIFVADLEALEANPADQRLSWRHGIGDSIRSKAERVREISNWLERQVLPTRSARGRG
jgi:GMP synthase (glutamine-hydrolysing)